LLFGSFEKQKPEVVSAPGRSAKIHHKTLSAYPMTARNNSFDENAVLDELRQFLPALSTGRTFTHRNPLQAFQHLRFHDALRHASEMLGYRTWLSLDEYRSLYNSKRVKPGVLEKVLVGQKGTARTFEWQDKVLMKKFPADATAPRIGQLRANWQKQYKTDPDARIHPRLFRILGNYLDHGVSDWKFPVHGQGFFDSMREMESNSFVSVFNTPRARNLLLHTSPSIEDLLTVIVGDETLFKQYLFDQQFAHRGWSGLVAWLERNGEILPNGSSITLYELIVFELLLEIDVLDDRLGTHWEPLASGLANRPKDLFAPVPADEKSEVLGIWQEAFEWSYYEGILAGFSRDRQNFTEGRTLTRIVTNAPDSLCIVGRPSVLRNLPNGHRAFLHSYDFAVDRDGELLKSTLETVIPSLGAASLEYFFARTAWTAVESNAALTDQIIGLFGIADSVSGDLRTGLPASLIEDLEPTRLLCVVEQFPETVLKVIDRLDAAVARWLANEWVHMVVTDPASGELRVLKNGELAAYKSDRRPVEDAVH